MVNNVSILLRHKKLLTEKKSAIRPENITLMQRSRGRRQSMRWKRICQQYQDDERDQKSPFHSSSLLPLHHLVIGRNEALSVAPFFSLAVTSPAVYHRPIVVRIVINFACISTHAYRHQLATQSMAHSMLCGRLFDRHDWSRKPSKHFPGPRIRGYIARGVKVCSQTNK